MGGSYVVVLLPEAKEKKISFLIVCITGSHTYFIQPCAISLVIIKNIAILKILFSLGLVELIFSTFLLLRKLVTNTYVI